MEPVSSGQTHVQSYKHSTNVFNLVLKMFKVINNDTITKLADLLDFEQIWDVY